MQVFTVAGLNSGSLNSGSSLFSGSLAALKHRGRIVDAEEVPEVPELPEVGRPPMRLLLPPMPQVSRFLLTAPAASVSLPEIPAISVEPLLGAGGIVDLPDVLPDVLPDITDLSDLSNLSELADLSDLVEAPQAFTTPYRLTTVVKNPCQVESWASVPLVYSTHAEDRRQERKLPKFDFLPADARLVDVDDERGHICAVCFKVQLPIPPDVLAREANEKAKRQEQRKQTGRELSSVAKRKRTSGALTRADFGIFLILATNGLVITTFKKDEEYQRWRHRKERKRYHMRYS